MANEAVILELDRPRVLRFRHLALQALQNKYKCKINELLSVLENPGIDDIGIFVLNGLLWEDKELTLAKVSELLDTHMEIGDTIERVNDALCNAFPNAKRMVEEQKAKQEQLNQTQSHPKTSTGTS